VDAVPLLASLAVAAAVVPVLVRGLSAAGLARANYRGVAAAYPAGIAIPLVGLLTLGLVAFAEHVADERIVAPGTADVVTYVLGVALLGLVDDLAGGQGPRGWRGHARTAARGGLSTGAIKAGGALALALYVLADPARDTGEYLLAVALLVLTTNLFNLLDLRPGRAIKALAILGAGLLAGSRDADPLWAVGVFLGPILFLLPLDLRERAMLGDTGASAVGAVAGLWLVLTLSTLGQAIALALVAVLTVYGEFRSISQAVDRLPPLRWLDSLGRSDA
jgi:UDP-GlcNAc:undecaprenyl-phosphate GlcNAc-1-phosphate transferase